MSTILKALRRLEQEKNARADRPLAEAVASAPPSAPPPPRRWPLVAGVAVAVAAVVGGGVFAFTQSRVAAPPAADVTADATSEVATTPAAVAVAPARPDPAAAAAAKRRLAQQELAARRQAKAAQSKPAPANPQGLPGYALTEDIAVVDRGRPKPRLQDPDAPLIAAKAAPEALVRDRGAPTAGAASRRGPEPSGGLGDAAPVGTVAQDVAAVPGGNPGGAPDPPERPRRDGAGTTAIAGATAAAAKAAASRPEQTQPLDLTQIAALQEAGDAPDTPAPESPAPEERSARVARTPSPKRPAEAAKPPEPTPAPVEVAAAKAEPAPKRSAVDSPPRPATPDRVVEPVQRRSSRLPAPEVHVVKTVWHPVASRRLAIVEIEATGEQVELREGESVETLVVETIEPSGVIFDNRGIEVRRRVGAR